MYTRNATFLPLNFHLLSSTYTNYFRTLLLLELPEKHLVSRILRDVDVLSKVSLGLVAHRESLLFSHDETG